MPIFHAETIIFENRHEKIGLTVIGNGNMTRKITFIIITLSAIFCTLYVQSDIKSKPQFYFIGFSGLTTILLFTKIKIIPETLYYILTGLMFYLMFFIISMFVIDWIAPNRATAILEDGRKVKFMDFTFIYAVLAGLILSIITVIKYVRSRNKIRLVTYEKYFALLTFVATFIQYCRYEYL